MRKLVESTFVTLDGVIGDPHVWGAPYWDEDHQEYGSKLLFEADTLLLGRETYEGSAEPSSSTAWSTSSTSGCSPSSRAAATGCSAA
ncbi:hypothetical protein ACGFJC_11200 [Nonomuraea fuscirosea]|uniref:hypothetical protein n=1 Tax=Nonomuraea fuscirosea TaxID=1291556 RepID=UPI00343D33F9